MGSLGDGQAPSASWPGNEDLDYDVLIIGGGLSGIYSLYRMRKLGLRTRVLEAGESEGGTWYWYVIPPVPAITKARR